MRMVPLLALPVTLLVTAGCSSAPMPPPESIPPAAAAAPGAPESNIRQLNERTYAVERSDGCEIRWILHVDRKTDDVTIEVKDACRYGGGLPRSLPIYGQLLDAVLLKHSRKHVRYLRSSSYKAVGSWDQDIAVAAMESGLWKTFLRNRKDKPKLESNAVFIGVFNQGNIHRKLSEVFEQRGLFLRLRAVERVFEKRFRNLPFAHEYAAYSASGTKVPYTAGTFVFEIKPIP